MTGKRYDVGLWLASQKGLQDLFDFCISRGANEWNNALYHASKNGHLDLVKLLFERGATDYGKGLEGAGSIGHRKIFDFITSIVPDHLSNQELWNYALYYAAFGGSRELVDICISKGATRWFWGFLGAEQRNRTDLIAFFEAKL